MPSNGINLEKTIDNLIDWSREYGGVVNKSCGLHVHTQFFSYRRSVYSGVGSLCLFSSGVKTER